MKIKKQTNNSHLNMYLVKNEGDTKYYQFVSRKKDINNLALKNKEIKSDAIRILPWYKEDNKIFLVLIEEYRITVDRFLLSLPAGLVDDGEEYEKAGIRELEEETGYTVKEVISVSRPYFVSPGLTDESIVTMEVEVYPTPHTQHLDENEIIKVKVFELEDIMKSLQSVENIGIQSKLIIENFYYRHKLLKRGIE